MQIKTISSFSKLLLLSVIALNLLNVRSSATTLTVLHSFSNGTDGSGLKSLIQAKDGYLYGGSFGGSGAAGVLFKSTTTGLLTPLHDYFYWDGAVIGLTLAKEGGIFYVTTGASGAPGSFYSINNVSNALYTGLGCADLADGVTSFLQGADGNFYGTRGAFFTGTNGGIVFQLIPQPVGPALYNELHIFGDGGTSENGANPTSLIQGADGLLYGITTDVGAHNAGTLFSISTTGEFTTLYSFDKSPISLMQAATGMLYGTTYYGGTGGGSVFQITTNGTGFLTICSSFSDANGLRPNGVIQGKDGALYGTTAYGGTNDFGTIFKLVPNGALSQFTRLVKFNGRNGTRPYGNLIQAADGNFYGMTTGGGAYSYGTLFKVSNLGLAGSADSIVAPPSIYNGLFYGSQVTHDSSGFFTFTLASNWKYSGKILINGGSYALSGAFNSNTLSTTKTIARPFPQRALTVTMTIGSLLSDGQVTGSVTDGIWTSSLLGDQAFYTGTNAPQTGTYTASVIPQAGQDFDGVSSPGYGSTATLTVKTNGSATISGTSADAAALAEVAYLSKDGQLPLYFPMYKGAGSMLGWVTFVDAQPAYKLNGNVSWIKMNSFGSYYSGGFTNSVQFIGSQRH